MWREHDGPRATLGRPTWRQAAPFIAVGLVGLVAAVLPPYYDRPWVYAAMVASSLASFAFLAVAIRRPERSWVDGASAYATVVAIALMRDVTGGSSSALTGLAALPMLWLAVTGTRKELLTAILLTIGASVVPSLVVGAPEYNTDDWKRAVVLGLIALAVMPAVQKIVQDLARETRRASEAAAEMDDIMRGARLTSMVVLGVDGAIRQFSTGAEQLLGYRASEVVGRDGLGLLHDPDELAEAAAELGVRRGIDVFAALAAAGAPARIWTYNRKDGRTLHVRLAVTELHDGVGAVTGYLSVALDESSAVESERELALSEARWRVLTDHLPDLTVLMIDEEFRILVVSGAGAAAQGLRGKEGKHLADVSNPSNLEILGRLAGKAFAGREASGFLFANATGDEHEVIATPLPPDAAGTKRVLFLGRNLSVERSRERELLRANHRSERLFADAPHGVAVLDVAGVVLQANAAFHAITAREPGELEGRSVTTLARPGDHTLGDHLDEVLAAPETTAEAHCVLRDAHGADVHAVVSSRLLSGDDGSDDIILVNLVDISEQRRFEDRLAHLADHDLLTGLANRRRFEAALQRHLEHCRSEGATGALLLMDLDHFKQVNDTLGHPAGDDLLIETATLLRSEVAARHEVARLGGDEFAVLLTDGDRAEAESVAQAIVDRVQQRHASLEGACRRVTASIGLVSFQAASEHGADVLALADMTMYDAKEAGRNRFVSLEEDRLRPPETGARMQVQARIDRALEEDGFVLLLQPIMDLHTDTVRSAEALLRLRDGDELVPPARFLHVAERAGLMPELDAWVIRHSAGLLARLRRIDPGFRLEVNLSGHSIGNSRIERAVVESLVEHRIDPGALILEVTETAAVADVGVAHEFAERLTQLGCRFALDDFGAGFGSFYYLKHLLFDYVKIDGEFVAASHRSAVDRTIMRSIVGIARDLGKETVAEFVSDPEILEVVRAEGVDHAQGFLIGRPVPFDDFVTHLAPAAG